MTSTPTTGPQGANNDPASGSGFVLGVNYTGYHDSSLTVLDRAFGISYAAAEERYTRYKKESRFPRHGLKIVEEKFLNIDAIGVAGSVPLEPPDQPDPFWHDERLRLREAYPVKPLAFDTKPFEALWPGRPFYYYDHHLCHAAAGYCMSGFDRALIITCDGGMEGCLWNAGVYTARRGEPIKFLHGRLQSHYVQLVRLYTDVTAILGFRPNLHEGKITGLAGRGKPNPACEAALLELEEELNRSTVPLYFWIGLHDETLPSSLEVNHRFAADMRERLGAFSREDIAHAVQAITERRILEYVRRAKAETGEDNLILSGGLFANVKINLECKRVGFENIFVCPPMSDEGLSLGAAILAAAEHWREPLPSRPTEHLFLAEQPDAATLPALLDSMGIISQQPESIHKTIAAELAAGKTVARVMGAMEYGPRALGHRSIFYQPTDPSVNDWLNQKLRRSEFMPFAPMVRAERAAGMFDELDGAGLTARFMTICLPCKPEFAAKCPAVVHVDNTARPQLVDRESAPDSFAILEQYEALTGLPAFINTSFNVHDEPIVHSYQDAVVAFFQSELDVLAIEDRLVYRDRNPAAARLVGATTTENVRQERNLRYRAEYAMGAQALKLGAEIDELHKANGYLEEQLASRVSHIKQLLQAKAYHEESIKRLEEAAASLEEAHAYLESRLNEREAYVKDLLEAKQYAGGEMARLAAAIDEKEAARAYLESQLAEREAYITEILEAKKYIEARLAGREQYVEDLIAAKEYLAAEVARRDAAAQEFEKGRHYLETRLAEREKYIEDLIAAKEYLAAEIAKRDAALQSFDERLAERERYINDILAAKQYLDAELARRDTALAEKDKARAYLQERLDERERYVAEIIAAKLYLDDELNRRGEAIKQLEASRFDLALKVQKLDETRAQWESKDSENRKAIEELKRQADLIRGDMLRLRSMLDDRATRIRQLESLITAFSASPVHKLVRPFSKAARDLGSIPDGDDQKP